MAWSYQHLRTAGDVGSCARGEPAFLRALTASRLARSGIHRQYGRITAREHIVAWAFHDLGHRRHILSAFQAERCDAIGGSQSLYPCLR